MRAQENPSKRRNQQLPHLPLQVALCHQALGTQKTVLMM